MAQHRSAPTRDGDDSAGSSIIIAPIIGHRAPPSVIPAEFIPSGLRRLSAVSSSRGAALASPSLNLLVVVQYSNLRNRLAGLLLIEPWLATATYERAGWRQMQCKEQALHGPRPILRYDGDGRRGTRERTSWLRPLVYYSAAFFTPIKKYAIFFFFHSTFFYLLIMV